MRPASINCVLAVLFELIITESFGDFGPFVEPSTRRCPHIVHPFIHEEEGSIRKVREINKSVYYEDERKLKVIEVGDWILELNPEHKLLIDSDFTSEWITESEVNVRAKIHNPCEHGGGFVRKFEGASFFAVTVCGSRVSGYIKVGRFGYLIQPLNESTGTHVLQPLLHLEKFYEGSIHRRAARFAENAESQTDANWEYFNLTGDIIDIGGGIQFAAENDQKSGSDEPLGETEEGVNKTVDASSADGPTNAMKNWRREESDEEEIGYIYDTAWEPEVNKKKPSQTSSKSPSKPRWLEIAIGVDHTVIGFHGRERVEQYVLSLMNIVSAIYQDPSLDANMKLVVSRLILMENKKQSVVRPGNAKRSLENVNAWNRRLHLSLAPGEPHHDIAIWLTRLDIGGPSGYAPVGGVCDPKRSCSLNKDEGLTSAFIIAHEMAHILGLSHDGDRKAGNDCEDETLMGSIMAPMVSATFHKFSWSQCSRQEFRKHANKWACLFNPPQNKNSIPLNTTLQYSFSMDEQCRMEFGDGYSLCRSFDIIEPCSHLWCAHTKSHLVCRTKKGPPLEGTECGFDKWCINGYCQEVDNTIFGRNPLINNPQDGGWSDWSPWGPCSRSCGTGVQFRTRKCDNPVPSYGGSDCFGLAEEWKICNTKPCPEPIRDIRAQQCKKLPRLLNLRNTPRENLTWLPYDSNQYDMKCKLICTSKETKELYVTGENLIDGTPCTYENSNDICIQGICQPLSCDGQLFSKVKTDYCGVCGGNNSDCSNVKSLYRKKLKREVSRIAVIPRLAREIKLEGNVSTHFIDPPVAFILKNRHKKKYTVTIPNAGVHTEIVEGTKFYYKKFRNRHLIWASGPVLAEMIFLLYVPKYEIESGANVSVRTEYYIHKDALVASKRFHWIMGGWGSCSASCGGGRRQRTAACWDEQNNKIVRRKYCSLIEKPFLETERCNTFSCNFNWIAGEWESCSATCGSHGVQSRELYCVPQSVLNGTNNDSLIKEEPWRYMVNPIKCSGMKPISTRPCYRIPCQSYWVFGEWSQCSKSCGTGISTRTSSCPPPAEGELFFTCGEAPPAQKKICKAHNERNTNKCKGYKKKPCSGDQSKFCSLPVLSKYCKLGGFRRLCCKSCSVFKLSPVTE